MAYIEIKDLHGKVIRIEGADTIIVTFGRTNNDKSFISASFESVIKIMENGIADLQKDRVVTGSFNGEN